MSPRALTSPLNLDAILQTIMEKMAEYFRPDTWSLLMWMRKKNEALFRQSRWGRRLRFCRRRV